MNYFIAAITVVVSFWLGMAVQYLLFGNENWDRGYDKGFEVCQMFQMHNDAIYPLEK